MSEIEIAPLDQAAPLNTTEQVFQALYAAVISLKLAPGTKVSEAEVAKQLGVSRQPVRDAFFRLSQLGFLSIRPQRATLITKISEKAVLESAYVRTALEVECMRDAIKRLTKSDITEIRAIMRAQSEAIKGESRADFHASDERFHEKLCEIAGQPQVWRLILEQKAHMDRIRFLTLSQSRQAAVMDEHEEIVRALETRDVEKAENMLREHLAGIEFALRQSREIYPEYFEDHA